MAVKAPLPRSTPRPEEVSPRPDAWTVAAAKQLVPISPARTAHMMRDTPSWVLWDPAIVRVEHQAGTTTQPGMLCRISVGTHRRSMRFVQMLMGASDDMAVFAGGGRRWRFIEVIGLRPQGPHSTAVHRRVEIQLCGPWRWLRPAVRAYAARHLRRSLAALT